MSALVGRSRESDTLEQLFGDENARGAVVLGSPGVGKSALLAHFVSTESSRGFSIQRAAGIATARTVPFAALAHLLSEPVSGGERLDTLRLAHRVIAGWTADSKPALVVDDAHLLDADSATLVHQLVLTGSVFVVAAIRHDPVGAGPIAALMLQTPVSTVELTGLSEIDTATLARAILDGSIERLTAAELISLSGGNPRYLHALIGDARTRGALTQIDGVWHRTGPLVGGSQVKRIFNETLSSLTREETEVLEILAMAERLPFSQLEQLVPSDVLGRVEHAGLVSVDSDCPRSSAYLTSDLMAEVVRRQLPVARSRSLGRQLAALIDDDAPGGGGTTPAPWQLENGTVGDEDAWRTAARHALIASDYRAAERYARAGLGVNEDILGRLLLAEALDGQSRHDEAEEVLSRIDSDADDDDELARGALIRMRHLRYFAGRPEEATRIGREALEVLSSEDWRDEIAADLSFHAGLAGNFTEAVEVGARVLQRPDASDRTVVSTLLVSTQGQVMLGQFDEALAATRRGVELTPGVADELPIAQDMLRVVQFQIELMSGRLFAAETAGREGVERAVRRRAASLVGIWEACLATAQMFRGKLIDAVDSYCAATGRLTLADPMRALPVTQCWRAFAEAQAGMIRAAELSLERVEPESLPDEFRVDALRNRVSAWLMAQTGDLLGAATTARSAGRHLADHTHVVWGCLALHDAVRFGHADLVADELAALADQVDGLLIPTMALHARAMAGMEATGLEDVGHAFAGMGATLFAAEAAAQAATLHQLQGNQHAAGRASTRASNLAASCEGSDTPALRQRIRFLTSREEEIARLAARGLSSGEISDRLIISRRTVDNHLGSVYTKLGLHRREELADIISVA